MRVLLLAALVLQAAASSPSSVPDVRTLHASAPKAIAEIDTVKVQGTPVGLAWNADGTIYLRVVQGKDKARHYQIATAPALSVGQTDGAPVWAAAYWDWKSAITAPNEPELKLDIEQRVDRSRAAGANSGAELAGSASGALVGNGNGRDSSMSQAVAINAANNQITNKIATLRFKGLVVGEWTNEAPQPGVRWGWAPAPMGLLAYVDAAGKVNIADREGRHITVPDATSASLPAWSMDGRRLIYLKKAGPTLYVLMSATIE